jgi:hypothetical protein
VKRYLLLVLLLLVSSPIIAQSDESLTQTINSVQTGIMVSLPDGYEVTFNESDSSLGVNGIDDLKFDIFSPASMVFYGLDDISTTQELIDGLLMDMLFVEDPITRAIDDREVISVIFNAGTGIQILIVIPLDNNQFAAIRTIEWQTVSHLPLLLNISATIEYNELVTNSESSSDNASQPNLPQKVVSKETGYTFNLPEDWDVEFESENRAILTLQNNRVELEVHAVVTIDDAQLDDEEKAKQALSVVLDANGWTRYSFEMQTVNGAELGIARYRTGGFEGMLVSVSLANDVLAVLDTVDWVDYRDMDIILDIASSFSYQTPLELENYAGTYQDAIAELEAEGIISSGGSIVFVESRAYFSGLGAFFTPLASNSPQTNFVMAANLEFTVGLAEPDLDNTETCSLLGHLKEDSTGAVTTFLEVGFNSFGAFYYFTALDAEYTNSAEFGMVDQRDPHHVMFVVNGEQAILFLDGIQVGAEIPVDEISGTFGIALRGNGPTAECIGDNVWVYRIPHAQDGACRVTSSSNVNRRTGAGTNYPVTGQLLANNTQGIIGKAVGTDGFIWWKLDNDSWVRNDVVQTVGDCREVETVEN